MNRIPVRADVPEFIGLFMRLDANPELKVRIMRALGIRPVFARGIGAGLSAASYEGRLSHDLGAKNVTHTFRPLFPRI